ncbi:hypothetical protein [Nocardia sp. NPDC004604]|uniref:hypothetical protein n=1 Tax=Nocardia sp. NPDC004604 TaxID=3157013 RepID=UPI0033ABD547
MREDMIVTPPRVCGYADIALAHQQMREHRACRIGLCVWKAAAYYTLVGAGRVTPQSLTPRERSAARGLEFPPLDREGSAQGGPTVRTLREVLDKLTELALPIPGANSGGDG